MKRVGGSHEGPSADTTSKGRAHSSRRGSAHCEAAHTWDHGAVDAEAHTAEQRTIVSRGHEARRREAQPSCQQQRAAKPKARRRGSINAMNAAILNADLPISIRMKRANRRGWMLDRRDNIKFLVQGVQAYRQLAAPLAWEGTFEQTRNQPAPFATFGQQSLDLEYEAFALKTRWMICSQSSTLELAMMCRNCTMPLTILRIWQM